MSSTKTRFEVQLPVFTSGTDQANSVASFLSSISSLTSIFQLNGFVGDVSSPTYANLFIGYLNPTDNNTALGYLNTLNTALGSNVQCVVNTVTSEP